MNDYVKVPSMYEPPIPLSILELDLPVPSASGWPAYLAALDISIVLDDLGRAAVSRADAKRLFDEHREHEARVREVRERNEQAAIEADRRRRAHLRPGIPADLIPPGVAPAVFMTQSEHDARPRRRSVMEHALSHEDQMVFHPIREMADEDES